MEGSSKLNAVIVLESEKISIKVSKRFIQRNFLSSVNLQATRDERDLDENNHKVFNCQEIEPILFRSLLTSTAISDTRDETVFWPDEKLDRIFGLLRLYRLVIDLKMSDVIVECVENALRSFVNNNNIDGDDGLVNTATACRIFQEASEVQFEKLSVKALDTILRCPSVVFEDEANYKMLTAESFKQIFSHNDLQVAHEAEVLNFAIKWARLEPESNYNERLTKVLPCIRLSQIADDLIMTMLQQKGILKLNQNKRSLRSRSDAEMPRNHYRPLQKLASKVVSEILSSLNDEEVISSVLDSPKVGKEVMSIIINISQMMQLGSELKGNSHKYNEIILHVDNLNNFPKESLLNYVNSSIHHGMEIGVKIVVQNITGASGYNQLVSMLNFFGAQSVNLEELIIDDFHCSIDLPDLLEIPQAIPSLTSIQVKTLTEPGKSQIKLLLNKNQCPNLKSIVMGNPLSKFQTTNIHLDEFVRELNDLQDVKFAWLFPLSFQNYPGDERANDFWLQLKQTGVMFNKICPFAGPARDHVSEKFLIHFEQDVEELYGLFSSHLKWALSKKIKLDNLKLMEVKCSVVVLLEALNGFQRLEKLIWQPEVCLCSELRAKLCSMSQVNCLKSIVFITTTIHDEGLRSLAWLSSFCPNVKSLSLRIHAVEFKAMDLTPIFHPSTLSSINFNMVYKKFPELENFEVELCESLGTATGILMGVPDESMQSRSHLITSFQGPPPCIGEFRKLRVLRIGRGWPWASKVNAFRSTLCRLKNLEEIAFPPMNLKSAVEVLDFLSNHVRQLKRVRIQVTYSPSSSTAEQMDMSPVPQDNILMDLDSDSDDGEGEGVEEEVTLNPVNVENVKGLQLTYGQFFEVTLEDWISNSNLQFGTRYLPSRAIDRRQTI